MPLSSRTVERDFPLMVKLSTVLYSTKAPSMLMFLTRVRRAAGGGGVFGAAGGGVAGAAGGGVEVGVLELIPKPRRFIC